VTTIVARALCCTAAILSLEAQDYSIDWHTIDGGGGTSTGGVYSVTGTIGQPVASPLMSGGNYTLLGGFWAIQAVQTPGAPLLSIARTTTNTVAVFWPSPSTDFTLQQSPNSVAGVNWSNVVAAPNDNGTTKYITSSFLLSHTHVSTSRYCETTRCAPLSLPVSARSSLSSAPVRLGFNVLMRASMPASNDSQPTQTDSNSTIGI
jgi:hypothetical protein